MSRRRVSNHSEMDYEEHIESEENEYSLEDKGDNYEKPAKQISRPDPSKTAGRDEINKVKKHYEQFLAQETDKLNRNLQILDGSFKNLIDLSNKFFRDTDRFEKFRTDIDQCGNEMRSLLNRINKNEFEVVFFGKEKAGKSTLICEWLDCPGLLPSSTKRCTYTTIEIIPSTDNADSIHIVYFTEKEFVSLLKGFTDRFERIKKKRHGNSLEATNEEEEALQGELNELNRCNEDDDFRRLLKKGTENINLKDSTRSSKKDRIQQIHNELQKFTEEKKARAVKSMTIHISFAKNLKCRVFDLPGFNSVTMLHKALAEERSKTADVVVFVREAIRPSIDVNELNMLNMFNRNDQLIPLKDKLVVAHTAIDRINTLKDFEDIKKASKDDFKKRQGLDQNQIKFVCMADKFKDSMSKMKPWGLRDNGVESLNELIDVCQYNSRLKSFSKRITTNNVEFMSQMKEFLNFAAQTLDRSDTESDSDESRLIGAEQDRHRAKWWKSEWKKIHENFAQFFKTIINTSSDDDDDDDELVLKDYNHINGDGDENDDNDTPEMPIRAVNDDDQTDGQTIVEDDIDTKSISSVSVSFDNEKINKTFENFQLKYNEMVDKMFEEIKSNDFNRRCKRIYDDQIEAGGVLAAGEGHSAIRKDLSKRIYQDLSKIVMVELANQAWQTISEMLNYILNEMYGLQEIKRELLLVSDQDFQIMLQQQIETLILRIARPAVELFIRYSRHDGRKECIKKFSNEVLVLDMFYMKNGVFERQGLHWYLVDGIVRNDPTFETLMKNLERTKFGRKTASFKEALTEIKQDLDKFQDYMKNSVYHGSGLEAFFKGQLDKIKKRFGNLENDQGQWDTLVAREIANENSKIPFTQERIKQNELKESAKAFKQLKQELEEAAKSN